MAVREATIGYFRHWCEICDEFNDWQHKEILAGNPTSEEQQEHKHTLKWMLRVSKSLHQMASDPDFPDRDVAELLAAKIWQHEQVWKLLYRPLSEAETEEAEMVLKEVFPNEPRA